MLRCKPSNLDLGFLDGNHLLKVCSCFPIYFSSVLLFIWRYDRNNFGS